MNEKQYEKQCMYLGGGSTKGSLLMTIAQGRRPEFGDGDHRQFHETLAGNTKRRDVRAGVLYFSHGRDCINFIQFSITLPHPNRVSAHTH
jgi:hypothetical protein